MVFVTSLTETLITLDITKTESNQLLFYNYTLNGKMEVMFLLLQ